MTPIPPASPSSPARPAPILWHALSPEEALATLKGDGERGLSPAQVAERRARYGENRLPERAGAAPWRRFLAQFAAPLVLVLLASALITALLGEWVDAGVIFAVTLVNGVIGYLQEGKAEAALAALARSVASQVPVLREGRRQTVAAAELVPGDLVLLAAGDRVPADLRLLRAQELRAMEAALTGESLPVAKSVAPLAPETLLADRANLAYGGTVVVAGSGLGLVVATGLETETGRISRLLAEAVSLDTPLTRRMARFSSLLLWIIGALALGTFAIGLARGERAFDMFMAAVALAVGAIPEGLPAAITVTLAIGVGRMARRRAIVRRLPAVETLGSTTVICTDKTGTLTENQMTVRELWAGGRRWQVSGTGYAPEGRITPLDNRAEETVGAGAMAAAMGASQVQRGAGKPEVLENADKADKAEAPSPSLAPGLPQAAGAATHFPPSTPIPSLAGLGQMEANLAVPAGSVDAGAPVPAGGLPPVVETCLLAGLLCNDGALVQQEGRWAISGDPTEGALIVAARKARPDWAGLSGTARSGAYARLDEIPFTSERQFMATRHATPAGPRFFVKGAVERLLGRCASQMGPQGQPQPLDTEVVLAQAREMAAQGLRVLALALGEGQDGPLTEASLAGLCLLGLVAMIDPPRQSAARAVAACRRAGIRVKMITGDQPGTALAIARQVGIADPGDGVLSGRDLGEMEAAELAQAAVRIHVFARVAPEQKLDLVRALQASGQVVAMTGDGVNDAPALKQADIGVAMGQGGTEVAKEAAAMVLTDDNFATVEAAVEEGRGIYDNLVKFITWTLPTNFGEGLVIVAAIVAGVTLPITPLQILWINMTTAVLLGLMLAFEPVEGAVMARPPRPPRAPILDRVLLWRIVLVSVLLLAGAFGLFLLEQARGHSLDLARSVAVNVFVLVETIYLFNCRSLTRPAFARDQGNNPAVWWGVGLMLVLQGLLTYWPPLQSIFAMAPLGWQEWGECLAVALVAGAVVEGEKAWRRF